MVKGYFVGRLTNDVVGYTDENKNIIYNFSVAVNYKDTTTYVACRAFGNKWDKVAAYLLKGKLVFIESTLSVNAYVNKRNEAVGALNANVTSIQLLGGKDA